MLLECIILEDDPIAAKSLSLFCQKHDHLQLKGIFDNGKAGLEFLENEYVDLVFLDIEMPLMNGIEFLDKMEFNPFIIVTTSDQRYAYNAIKNDAVDFLIKPVEMAEFEEAVEKVIQKKRMELRMRELNVDEEIYVRANGKLVRVQVEDIFYFENVGDYVKIITRNGNHIIHGALKSIDQKLSHPKLLKVHRSFIINLNKIKDIVDNSIVVENKKIIPVSRAHRQALLSKLNII